MSKKSNDNARLNYSNILYAKYKPYFLDHKKFIKEDTILLKNYEFKHFEVLHELTKEEEITAFNNRKSKDFNILSGSHIIDFRKRCRSLADRLLQNYLKHSKLNNIYILYEYKFFIYDLLPNILLSHHLMLNNEKYLFPEVSIFDIFFYIWFDDSSFTSEDLRSIRSEIKSRFSEKNFWASADFNKYISKKEEDIIKASEYYSPYVKIFDKYYDHLAPRKGRKNIDLLFPFVYVESEYELYLKHKNIYDHTKIITLMLDDNIEKNVGGQYQHRVAEMLRVIILMFLEFFWVPLDENNDLIISSSLLFTKIMTDFEIKSLRDNLNDYSAFSCFLIDKKLYVLNETNDALLELLGYYRINEDELLSTFEDEEVNNLRNTSSDIRCNELDIMYVICNKVKRICKSIDCYNNINQAHYHKKVREMNMIIVQMSKILENDLSNKINAVNNVVLNKDRSDRVDYSLDDDIFDLPLSDFRIRFFKHYFNDVLIESLYEGFIKNKLRQLRKKNIIDEKEGDVLEDPSILLKYYM